MKKLWGFSILAFVFLTFASDSLACLCDALPNPPCRAYWETPAIFSGVVTSITPINTDGVGERKVSIKVERAYKGIDKNQVEVFTGDGRMDCGFPFEVGERYLVYANNYNDVLSTSYCMRTHNLSRAKEDIDYIEGLPSMPDGVTIFGNIAKIGRFSYVTKPIVNLGIKIEGPDSGRTESLRTDGKGNFKIQGIPAGIYLVNPLLPKETSFYAYGRDDNNLAYRVSNRGCLQIDFAAYFEGKIQGRVLSATGKNVAGYDVQLISADYEFKNSTDMAALLTWDVSEANGSFMFEGVPPGRYKLGIGIGGAPDVFLKKGRIFYPGTVDPKKAKIITVGDGPTTIEADFPEPMQRSVKQ